MGGGDEGGGPGANIFFVLSSGLSLSENGIVGIGQGGVMIKPISGQFKVNLDTGQVFIVGSKAISRLRRSRLASYSGVRTR